MRAWAIGAMVLMPLLVAIGPQAGEVQIQPTPDCTTGIGIDYTMAQLVIGVLAVLMISGEYSTGMFRASLAATHAPMLNNSGRVVALGGPTTLRDL